MVAGRPCRPEVPVGVRLQFLPPFVAWVERLEEGGGISDVDDHREVELRGRRPQRIEPLVINGDETSVGVAGSEPQRFPDLEAVSSAPCGVLKAPRFCLPECWISCPSFVVWPCKDHNSVLVGCPPIDYAREIIAEAWFKRNDRLDASIVEHRDDFCDRQVGQLLTPERADMVVEVDYRETRPRH